MCTIHCKRRRARVLCVERVRSPRWVGATTRSGDRSWQEEIGRRPVGCPMKRAVTRGSGVSHVRDARSNVKMELSLMPPPTAETLKAWLVSHLAALRGLDAGAIDVRERFSRYGLDS